MMVSLGTLPEMKPRDFADWPSTKIVSISEMGEALIAFC
jgi:hypothetical protein